MMKPSIAMSYFTDEKSEFRRMNRKVCDSIETDRTLETKINNMKLIVSELPPFIKTFFMTSSCFHRYTKGKTFVHILKSSYIFCKLIIVEYIKSKRFNTCSFFSGCRTYIFKLHICKDLSVA